MGFRVSTPARFQSLFVKGLAQIELRSLLANAACSAAVYAWALLFWTRFGGQAEGRVAAVMGIACGLALAPLAERLSKRALAAGLLVWTLALPVIVDLAATMLGVLPNFILESSVGLQIASSVCGVLVFAPGVAIARCLIRGTRQSVTYGLAFGPLLAFALSLLTPISLLGAIAAAGCIAVIWTSEPDTRRLRRQSGALRWNSVEIALAIASGLTLGVALRFVGQWYLWVPHTWASILIAGGIASGIRARWSTAAVLAFISGLLLLGYSAVVHVSFAAAVAADSAFTAVVASMLLSVGVLVGPWVAVIATCRRGSSERVLVAGVGTAIGMTAIVEPTLALISASCVGVAGALRVSNLTWRSIAISGCAMTLLGAALGTYAPALLPRLLHSSSAMAMTRSGTPKSEIFGADESRLDAVLETTDGVLTTWATRGFQSVTCVDGHLQGSLAVDDMLGPRIATDVLAGVVPLALHSSPTTISVVGLGSGETTLTLAEFGMATVTAFDRPEHVERLRRVAASRLSESAASAIHAVPIPARMATDAGRIEQSDIIVVDFPSPALLGNAGTTTVTFVRGLRQHLHPDGVVCQRYRTSGLYAKDLLSLGAAYQKCFQQTQLLEIGPGDWLVIGTDRPGPLFDYDFIDRLQREDVRFALAKASLDWSIVMSLYGLGGDDLASALEKANVSAASVLSARDTRLQGVEVLRRDPNRFASFTDAISPFVKRPADMFEDSVLVREIEGRLADIKQANTVLAESTDQFWAYRATIKDRLKSRPRAAIQQVSYDDKPTLHPEDVRRKLYLAALGSAISEQDPSVIEQFEHPFDPLVSYFLHGEASRIARERGDAENAFRHQMVSVYGTSNDLSSASAVDALDALSNGVGGDDVRRYDLAQGLLEQLRRRWHLRVQKGELDRLAQESLRYTIRQTRETLDVLDSIVEANPQLASHWEMREPILRRDLIENLRLHQRAIQENNVRREQMRAALKQKLEASE